MRTIRTIIFFFMAGMAMIYISGCGAMIDVMGSMVQKIYTESVNTYDRNDMFNLSEDCRWKGKEFKITVKDSTGKSAGIYQVMEKSLKLKKYHITSILQRAGCLLSVDVDYVGELNKADSVYTGTRYGGFHHSFYGIKRDIIKDKEKEDAVKNLRLKMGGKPSIALIANISLRVGNSEKRGILAIAMERIENARPKDEEEVLIRLSGEQIAGIF